jgi:hypothetical protein
MTAMVGAAREATTGARRKSKEAARLFDDLMALDPDVRREFIRGLGERELVEVFATAQREGGTPYALYVDDAYGFVSDVLGENTWSISREILRALSVHNMIAVPSCFSSSKSWTLSRSTLWFSNVHPVGTARVVTLAPCGGRSRGSCGATRSGARTPARRCPARSARSPTRSRTGTGSSGRLRKGSSATPGTKRQRRACTVRTCWSSSTRRAASPTA